LKKILFIIFFVYVSGFLTGHQVSGGPKGMELLLFITLASISGFATGAFLTKAIYKYKVWKQNPDAALKIMGYKINIRADQSTEVEKKRLELVKEESHPKSTKEKPVNIKCDLCKGEPVRLAGQKIKCPKCKGEKALAN
jgi:hypothetical protein